MGRDAPFTPHDRAPGCFSPAYEPPTPTTDRGEAARPAGDATPRLPIGLAQLEVAPWAPPADVARELVDTWARLFWGPDGAAHSHRMTETRRLAADGGRRYLGAHVRAEVSAPSAGPCLGSTGVVHAVVLGTGGDYNVLVVVARLDGDPRHAQVPTTREVDELVAAARPTR